MQLLNVGWSPQIRGFSATGQRVAEGHSKEEGEAKGRDA